MKARNKLFAFEKVSNLCSKSGILQLSYLFWLIFCIKIKEDVEEVNEVKSVKVPSLKLTYSVSLNSLVQPFLTKQLDMFMEKKSFSEQNLSLKSEYKSNYSGKLTWGFEFTNENRTKCMPFIDDEKTSEVTSSFLQGDKSIKINLEVSNNFDFNLCQYNENQSENEMNTEIEDEIQNNLNSLSSYKSIILIFKISFKT